MACKSRAEISEKVREEVGFRVVRTADRSGRAEFGQFPGDAAGFGELLGGKLLGGRLGYILMGSGCRFASGVQDAWDCQSCLLLSSSLPTRAKRFLVLNVIFLVR